MVSSISVSCAKISFMEQVSNLIKVFDSRNITKLQLKQSDCELIIRKKEVLQLPEPTPNVPWPRTPFIFLTMSFFQSPTIATSGHQPLHAKPRTCSHCHEFNHGTFTYEFRGSQLSLRAFEALLLLQNNYYFMHKYLLNGEINYVVMKFM